MAKLTFNKTVYVVDHAVKGANYVHGYSAAGDLLVSIEGITDFSKVTYDGVYLTPEACVSEACNNVKHLNGALVRNDGTAITPAQFGAAPAGYGLGTTGQLINDWNTAVKSGFYYGNKNSPDSGWWAGAVYGNSNNYAFQHLFKSDNPSLHKIREMSNGTWGNWVDCGPSAFAPAGYGLGAWAKLTTDLNSTKECGWYFFGSSAANKPPYSGVGVLLVLNRNYTYEVTQIAWEITTGAMTQRVYNAGSWSSWEFVNPPMSEGVEYRTTERVDSKVVYKKNVDGVIKYRLDGETEWKNQNVLMGAAPAGYGLGTIGPSVTDANHIFEVFRNGWYRTTSTTANTAVTHGAGIALVYDANRAFHLLAKTTAGTMRTRYTPKSDGVFVEELINPPMSAGNEYPTIERWGSGTTTVYTKRISFGQLPASNYAEVSTGITGGTLVSLTGTFYDDAGGAESYPIITSSGVKCMAWVENGCSLLTVQVLSDCSKYTGEFVIKYTKG